MAWMSDFMMVCLGVFAFSTAKLPVRSRSIEVHSIDPAMVDKQLLSGHIVPVIETIEWIELLK
jgi:hypothetical protein